jgi:hypothetical protein
MPTNNTNATTPTGDPRAASEPATTPAAAGRTDTEDSLWVALLDQPGATAAQLSLAAGIGRSTASKILATWHEAGTVTRTPGIADGGKRAADRWRITDTDQHTGPGQPADPEGTATEEPPSNDDTNGADDAEPDTGHYPSTAADSPADEGAESPSDADTDDTTTEDLEASTIHTNAAQTGRVPEPADPIDTNTDTEVAESVVPAHAPNTSTTGKKRRLGGGELRGQVEEFLRDHEDEAFGPSAIGKALGRSSGAVNNALEKLVTDGYAMRTSDKPKRFTLKTTTD